jgi:hypothetical protein
MKPFDRGPGLAKTRRPPLLSTRTVSLVTGSDARWKALLDDADVVSEGASRGDDPSRRYFGSTNIRLALGPERPGDDMERLAALAARDPHVRLRAVRLARREAAQRADGPLDCVRSETTVTHSSTAVTIHVEVEARVFPDRRVAPRPRALAVDS